MTVHEPAPPARDRAGARNRGALQIAGLYALIGVLWILFSDQLAEAVVGASPMLTTVSIVKGWGYVVVTVDVRRLVEKVVAESLAAHGEPSVEVRIDDLPPAEADPALLKQVWGHLISNSLKFTRPRAPARIEVGSLSGDGHPVYFVRDNGVGFDMGQSDRLFRAFQRLHHAEDFPGTGVGLTIVEHIIRRHGGRVWVEAAVDQGATFYFTLRE